MTHSGEAQQELAYVVGKERAASLLSAVRAEVLREAADTAQQVGNDAYYDAGQRHAEGAWRVRDELRRMADAAEGGE